MKRIVNAGPTIRGTSGRIGQTSCRNMLRRPRRDRMPVKVDVPTRNNASRVAEDNSAMRTSHSPAARLSDLQGDEQGAARQSSRSPVSRDPCKTGQNRAKSSIRRRDLTLSSSITPCRSDTCKPLPGAAEQGTVFAD
jgi:hypothetical protein